MRIRYDREADVLHLRIGDAAPVDAVEEPGGVVISYSATGEPVSVELLNASKRQLVQAGEITVTLESQSAA